MDAFILSCDAVLLSFFSGEWFEGMRHGQGKCKFINGDIYEGEWKEDKMHGNLFATFGDSETLL